MCGITGILAFNDAFSLDEATVTRMSDTLRHRLVSGGREVDDRYRR